MLKTALRMACAASVLACLTEPAGAQSVDKRTVFTFSGPVTLPGISLPAGKYEFRLVNATSNANVVQVLNAGGTNPYAMFFSTRVERPDPATKPEVSFLETAPGMPAAIKTWWYPGERSGYEFVYPKEQARRLAKGSNEPVLTTRAETITAEQTNTSDLTRISPTGQEITAGASPYAGAQGGDQSTTGQDSNAQSSSAQDSQTRETLPRTASVLPLVAWIGTLTLSGGVGVWRYRRARA